MVENICVSKWAIDGKWGKLTFQIFGGFEFIVHYLVHITSFLYLYGKVIGRSNKVLRNAEDTTSTATQKVLYPSY